MTNSAPIPDPVQRVLRFAGKKRSEVSNPCLTARETIVIANWIQINLAASKIMQKETICKYPQCVDDGPDGKCTDWLIGACSGPST